MQFQLAFPSKAYRVPVQAIGTWTSRAEQSTRVTPVAWRRSTDLGMRFYPTCKLPIALFPLLSFLITNSRPIRHREIEIHDASVRMDCNSFALLIRHPHSDVSIFYGQQDILRQTPALFPLTNSSEPGFLRRTTFSYRSLAESFRSSVLAISTNGTQFTLEQHLEHGCRTMDLLWSRLRARRRKALRYLGLS